MFLMFGHDNPDPRRHFFQCRRISDGRGMIEEQTMAGFTLTGHAK
jgi:hypothetical protein